nr:MAG TPA: hypothetical protein [Caudoviricetes sp.]
MPRVLKQLQALHDLLLIPHSACLADGPRAALERVRFKSDPKHLGPKTLRDQRREQITPWVRPLQVTPVVIGQNARVNKAVNHRLKRRHVIVGIAPTRVREAQPSDKPQPVRLLDASRASANHRHRAQTLHSRSHTTPITTIIKRKHLRSRHQNFVERPDRPHRPPSIQSPTFASSAGAYPRSRVKSMTTRAQAECVIALIAVASLSASMVMRMFAPWGAMRVRHTGHVVTYAGAFRIRFTAIIWPPPRPARRR